MGPLRRPRVAFGDDRPPQSLGGVRLYSPTSVADLQGSPELICKLNIKIPANLPQIARMALQPATSTRDCARPFPLAGWRTEARKATKSVELGSSAMRRLLLSA